MNQVKSLVLICGIVSAARALDLIKAKPVSKDFLADAQNSGKFRFAY